MNVGTVPPARCCPITGVFCGIGVLGGSSSYSLYSDSSSLLSCALELSAVPLYAPVFPLYALAVPPYATAIGSPSYSLSSRPSTWSDSRSAPTISSNADCRRIRSALPLFRCCWCDGGSSTDSVDVTESLGPCRTLLSDALTLPSDALSVSASLKYVCRGLGVCCVCESRFSTCAVLSDSFDGRAGRVWYCLLVLGDASARRVDDDGSRVDEDGSRSLSDDECDGLVITSLRR